jgi:hypothetical protein
MVLSRIDQLSFSFGPGRLCMARGTARLLLRRRLDPLLYFKLCDAAPQVGFEVSY